MIASSNHDAIATRTACVFEAARLLLR